ncbi:ATP-binding cassette domain-containing protein [Pontibacter silvestris]|uniref:ATP-binding cassette domain-containing protein n=1 Tax=Pontibacter silvestris TaxID=2305183 RepID=A0ABW4WTY5_9BACT|nr:ATP-binding cassette domain-containing protein [Pontibacter silvestris]MCC9137263.1 ATP-binding cassette domain-containing protein [Pontibacter silvestris]
MPKHTLEVDSIMYSTGGRLLLSDVYLKCQTGEVVGLLGRNGSGKTTLLKIIFGTKTTDNKFIQIDGNVCNTPYTHKGLIGYLPQEGFLPHALSISTIIRIFLDDKQKQQELLAHESVQQHLNKKTAELSTGERRYIELLLLLQLDAEFLLLDEPFSGIASLQVERIQELIEANRLTKGFLVTDHDYKAVLEISNQLLLLVDGACRHIKHRDELMQWGYVPAGSFS